MDLICLILASLLSASGTDYTDEKYLLWESKQGNTHCQGGFSYSNGNLTVPRSGIYNIFLQITYHCNDHQVVLLKHTVHSVSDAYDIDSPLLSAEETVSHDPSGWSKSIYTSGSYYLKANSVLRVASTHLKHISKNEKLVFFGVHLLSDQPEVDVSSIP